jgi:hypothetical protein
MGDSKGGEVMSRKDYVKTANILKGFSQEIHPQVFEDMVDLFCDWFQSDNENFDKAKFEKACGVDELGLIDA